MRMLSTNLCELHHPFHLLFELSDVNCSQKEFDRFLSLAYQQCLTRLQQAAFSEGLIDKKSAPDSIQQYLKLLKSFEQKQKQPGLFNRWSSLEQELEESITNQAMALAYHHHWQQALKTQAHSYSSLWAWLTEHHDRQDIMMFLEQWGCAGHPYHPNFRMKKGFSAEDVIQYSPEFNTEVAIHWGAVHRDRAFISIDQMSYQLLFASHYSFEFSSWSLQLQQHQLNPDDYLPLPVHPWQWENKLKLLCSSLIDSKEFLLIPELQKAKPSMSFRTVMPFNPLAPHLKLATGVHTTSAMRTVSPASVFNSSVVSKWLTNVLELHNHFGGCLFLARDLAGINIADSSILPHEKKHTGMIVRENPLQLANESQQLVPLAALFGRSPVSNTSLLIELIKQSKQNPKAYFSEYCHCVLAGQLYLLLKYGVALEAHQQNTLVMFQNSRPVGLVIRDLGGINICYHEIYNQVSKPVLHAESSIACTELKDLSNKFIHGNLISNLSPWINSLHLVYGISIDSLWLQVRSVLKGLLEHYRTEVHPAVYQWFHQKLLVRSWQQKSLLTMRLNQDQDETVFFKCDNPLSQFDD